MITERLDGTKQNDEGLTPLEVLRKTEDALQDPTVTRIEITPRWERRKEQREATKTHGKRRTYR